VNIRKPKGKTAHDQASRKQRERAPPLLERIEAERNQLFKVISIVEMVGAACGSVVMKRCPDGATGALEAACDILNRVAGELEVIGSEVGREARTGAPL